MSRKREIYARNVTGLRRPAIFGRAPVKLHAFTLTMREFGRFRAPVHHGMHSDVSRDYARAKAEDVNGVKSVFLAIQHSPQLQTRGDNSLRQLVVYTTF